MDQSIKIKNKKFKETGDSIHIYQNELDKACFQHDLAYGDFKDLNRRTAADKSFNIPKNSKYDGYQCGLVSMVHNFFDKKISGGAILKEFKQNDELAAELHKPIRKIE